MPPTTLIDHPHLDSDGHGLGWRPSPDARNRAFPMAKALDIAPPKIARTSYTWRAGPRVDQGQTSKCTGYSAENFLLAAPIMDHPSKIPRGDEIYAMCKEIDGAPLEDGSTTNALMHVLRDRMKRIEQWVWCYDETTFKEWVLGKGGVFIGVWWYSGMMDTDKKGFIHPAGSKVGGHETFVIGYSAVRDAFRIKNSWGDHWGEGGLAWLHREDLNDLLLDDGEAAAALEVKVL